jgi:hypothetical protein
MFRAGDWVEVRSAEEILATLDANGRLDALPFMPEMLQFCGRRFRVAKSAHKTCDTIRSYQSRWMDGAVHLEGLRCDGSAHGGCEARCLLFWKNTWLKPLADRGTGPSGERGTTSPELARQDGRALTLLGQHAKVSHDGEEERYSCQATEVRAATAPLRWWDPRHYLYDLVSGNVALGEFVRYVGLAAVNVVLRRWRREPTYPYVPGLATGKVPARLLDLQPGELAQVRSRDEIMQTINKKRNNRGLSFDVEMEPFCGGTYKVLARVAKLIDEKSGRMLHISSDCIILDGVACGGCLSRNRLFCPRAIYSYWRETWLKRVTPTEQAEGAPASEQSV